MKNNLILLIILFWATSSFAQEADTTWKMDGILGLNGSQVSLTNWAAGGEKSLSTTALLEFNANYAKGKSRWNNNLSMAYGSQIQGEREARKSDDKFELTSKFGYNTKVDEWFYAALFSMKTQLTEGFEYDENDASTKISDMFAPAYFVYSLGMDYSPNKILSIYISPVTGKTTVVTAPLLVEKGVYGLESGEKSLSELGGFVKIEVKANLMKNITLQSKIELFSSYTEKPENIDVNWDLLISMKVNKYITTNITTNLIYDDDIDITDKDGNVGPRIQFKEVVSVGFAYKF